MALQGTIQDFALPDIFQLIGIQRKTGILTLSSGQEAVTVKFVEGQVVGAETRSETLEDRLGVLLVRSGRVTEAQLQEALRIQKNTLQRLGYILVSSGYLSEEQLVEALRVQSTQIIYRLFRWREGMYDFTAVEDVEYDRRHFMPISSETILMEGARMIDEWPIIERKVRSAGMVLRRTALADALDLVPPSAGYDADRPGHDFDQRSAEAAERGRGALPSEDERGILSLLDGKRTVQEVCDLSILGEFDCYRILSDLLTRNLVEEAPRGRETQGTGQRTRAVERIVAGAAALAVVLTAVVAVATIRSNPLTPWGLLLRHPATDPLRHYTSLARLERIARAVEIFYLDAGTLPRNLAVLTQNGYLDTEDVDDPWGRPYRYQLSAGGYQLIGHDAGGEVSTELTLSRRFSPAQRMMLAGEGSAVP